MTAGKRSPSSDHDGSPLGTAGLALHLPSTASFAVTALEQAPPAYARRVADLSILAPGLLLDPGGFWTGEDVPAISYPDHGSDCCFSIENDSFWFRHRNRMIVEVVRATPPARGPIFDVGAGNGYVAAGLLAGGFEVVAIEPARTGAANAVRRGVNPVVCGTLESAGFLDQTAGGIGLFDVLEHIEDDLGYLRSLRRYLKPGGSLYITAPAHRALWSDEDEQAGHFRRYSLPALRDVVERAGFEVAFDTYMFTFLPLPILLCRTIPSRLLPRSLGSRAKAHHGSGNRGIGRLIERGLMFETAWLRRRKRILFGASCLIAARVREGNDV